MTKQEVHELLVDYIDYHAKEKNINDDQYFKMKATARVYAKGHLEKVDSSSRIISESDDICPDNIKRDPIPIESTKLYQKVQEIKERTAVCD